MKSVIFSKSAENDLEKIADRIALDNPDRALTFIIELREHTFALLTAPLMGVEIKFSRKSIRMLIYGKYLIFYRVHKKDIQILRFIHSARERKSFIT